MIGTPLIHGEIMQLYNGDMEKMCQNRNTGVPGKRSGESRDAANAALFPVSNKEKCITGRILTVGEGLVLTDGYWCRS